MNVQLTKMELIEMLLNTRKEAILEKVRAVLEEDQDQLTADDYKIIDNRRNRHLNSESKSFSWKEAKESILKS
jgi:vacuolar-type H+-ATPase subunit D/Vma8